MDNSADSLALRRNPLNIRASDGSDIVVGKVPRQAKAEMHELTITPEQALAATPDYDTTNSDHEDSLPTNELSDQLTDLGIGAAPSTARNSSVAPLSPGRLRLRASESMDLSAVDLDFGTDISNDLGGFLSRKQTIALRSKPNAANAPANTGAAGAAGAAETAGTAAPKLQSGPSRDKQLIQRLRSIRKRLSSDSLPQVPDADIDDDVRRAEGLPDDVLKMIAFSPDSPWLGSEIPNESDSETEGGETNATTKNAGGQESAQEKTINSQTKGNANQGNIKQDDVLQGDVTQGNITEGDVTQDETSEPSAIHETGTGVAAELNPFRGPSDSSPESYISESLTPLSENSDYNELSVHKQPQQRPLVPTSPLIEETDPVSPEDRGRLFLQVNKLANVRGLPIDPNRHPRFTLMLDNGIQTVTTEPTPLPSPGFNGLLTAKIGQEFELVVAQDLELVVTVNVQMDALQPPPRPVAPRINRHAPTESVVSTNTTYSKSSSNGGSATSSPVKGVRNLLRSPKKKQSEKFRRQQQEREREEQRELELIERQQQLQEIERKRYDKDLAEFHRRADTWRNITGPGGEYCRGYMFETHYERDIYGKAKSFALPLYNEWDKASAGVPKPVCDLQITMMYVPKLYGSEHIPMSMKECQQELQTAAEKRSVAIQGFLTQQGGDCMNTWRRRWFTLNEAEMVGHHEATRKRRALIHLENAVAVKDTLSDDLWCIYEDRSFEISFDDGEALSFYADSVEERDQWVKALRSSLANCTGRRRTWTDLVLSRQAAEN